MSVSIWILIVGILFLISGFTTMYKNMDDAVEGFSLCVIGLILAGSSLLEIFL